MHRNQPQLILFLVLGLAGAVLVLGLTVMLGWHLQLPALFQLRADLVPMQYNTALGFVLIGAALLALGRGHGRWAQIGAPSRH